LARNEGFRAFADEIAKRSRRTRTWIWKLIGWRLHQDGREHQELLATPAWTFMQRPGAAIFIPARSGVLVEVGAGKAGLQQGRIQHWCGTSRCKSPRAFRTLFPASTWPEVIAKEREIGAQSDR